MKKLFLLTTIATTLFCGEIASQCEATNEVATSPIMINNTGISADAVALLSGEYVLINNAISGDNYSITVTQNVINPGHEPFLTVRLATDNSVITSGYTPLQFLATSNLIEVHYHYDDSCSENLDLSILAFQNISTLSLTNIDENPNIKLFPNPTTGKLNLETEINLSSVEIYNVSGQLISEVGLTNKNEVIDLSEFNNGIYFLRFRAMENVYTAKIVKRQ